MKPNILKNLIVSTLVFPFIAATAFAVEEIESAKKIQSTTVKNAIESSRQFKQYELNEFKNYLEANVEKDIINLNGNFEFFPDDAKINLTLDNIDVASVLKIIADEGGKNIVIDESVKGYINADLRNISLNEAFKLILISEELESRIEDGTVLVASRSTMAKRGLSRKFVKTFKLNNANAVEVAQILEASVFNKGYSVKEDEAGSTAAPAPTPAPSNSGQQATQTSTPAGSSTGESTLANAKTIRGKVEKLSKGDGFGDADILASTVKLQYKSAETGDIKISNNDGGAIVVPDTRTNSILVSGLKRDILLAQQAIKHLDKPLNQVAIEVSLIEITKEDMKNLGLSQDGYRSKGTFGFNSISNNALHGLGAAANQAFMVFDSTKNFNEDFYIRLNSLFQEEKAKLLANPTVVALDGSESLVKITDEVVSKMDIMVTQNSVTYNVETAEVGIVLNILPKIGDDGFVTMRVRPSITTPLPEKAVGASGGYITPISTREVIIQDTRVKSGGTLAIAGLLKDNEIKTEGKVPLLGSLPLLGHLFRSTDYRNVKTELVILITPKVMDNELSI